MGLNEKLEKTRLEMKAFFEKRNKEDKIKSNKKILNIGCGYTLDGTDRIDIMKTPATTKVWNVENGLPYKNNVFDKIICNRVLEHLRDLKKFMNECHRVLRNKGKIAVITDNAGYIIFHIKNEHNQTLKVKGYIKCLNDYHYHLFVPSHLKYLFKMAGFKKIKIRYVQINRTFIKKAFLSLLPFNMGKEEIKVEAIK